MRVLRMPGCELKSFVVVDVSYCFVHSFCNIIFLLATLYGEIERFLVEFCAWSPAFVTLVLCLAYFRER